jgi:hypothetical protein
MFLHILAPLTKNEQLSYRATGSPFTNDEDTPPLLHPGPPTQPLSPPITHTAPPLMKKRKSIGRQTPEPSTLMASKRKHGSNIIETFDEVSRHDDAMMKAHLDASTQIHLRELELKAQEKKEEWAAAKRKSMCKYKMQNQHQKYMLQMQLLQMQLQVQIAQAKAGSSSSSLGLDGFEMDGLSMPVDPSILGVGSPGSSSFSNTPSLASPYEFNNEFPVLPETFNPTDNGMSNPTQ